MKKGKALIFFSIFICSLFLWAIWEAFLNAIVPRTRVRFKDFESFRNKAENSFLSMSVPESQEDIKYYYHVEWFQYFAGFSVTLSDEDYRQMIESNIAVYKNINPTESTKYLYTYNEDDIQYAQGNNLEENGICFYKKLLLENEEIKDFYIVALRNEEGIHEYYNCVLANDNGNRVMELSFRNTNPQYDK